MGIICEFSRKTFLKDTYSYLGNGNYGGKAEGLKILHKISENSVFSNFPDFDVCIPRTVVITTSYFDQFMNENNLYKFAASTNEDNRIVHQFQKASLPSDILGDLREISSNIRSPLAIRSSSLLEDSAETPMAGMYVTKMIPCNQTNADIRFLRLTDAIKLIYASTFFSNSKISMSATNNNIYDEKMAVIIQDVAGDLHNRSFYPDISGVARTFNYYPTGHSESKDGVISLALGLGKFIVDGGNPWPYSPAYPSSPPPYNSVNDMMKNTQNYYWAIDMNNKYYNPVSESEYLKKLSLKEAEYDNTIKYAASTYDPYSDRLEPGVHTKGPRIITFAPILQNNELPLNNLLSKLMNVCTEELGTEVEIEFAVTISKNSEFKNLLSLLQVRPLNISEEKVSIDLDNIKTRKVIIHSKNTMGNGNIQNIKDLVFVNPDDFNFKDSNTIAKEIGLINKEMLDQNLKYVLIGFGRWGSSDPWLGIPVTWSMISMAGVIVEASLHGRPVDMSQGSHFFHNIANLKIPYICIDEYAGDSINWEWLNTLYYNPDQSIVKRVKLDKALKIMIDGRIKTGVIAN
jgi:pyruvate phosphate dikinase-like enzyme